MSHEEGGASGRPTVIGLCATCRFMREVESRRGSAFFLCERSKWDDRFPKYPRIPVLRCRGFEERGPDRSDDDDNSKER